MSLEALLMWQTYTNTSHSCAARGIKNSPAIFQNEVMTLASLNAEELVAKVSMEHGGFWDAIQLGNTARLCGSIRAVKLELSHCVRTRARWKVLWNSKKSVVWVNNQPLSVKLTGSTALAQRGPRNPTIYIRKYSELDRQAGRQADRHAGIGKRPPSSSSHCWTCRIHVMNLRRILMRPELRWPEVDSNPVPREIVSPA